MRIRTMEDRTRKVYLHQDTIREYGLSDASYVTLKIGIYEKKVQLIPRTTGERDVILLSKDISEQVNLPTDLQYEVLVKDGEMKIGPVLGLLVSQREEGMNPKRLSVYLNMVTRYPEVNGLVIAFSTEGIMDDEQKVIGYAYDPQKKSWIRGVYVFPSAVYVRRASVNLALHDRLRKLVGNNFYNSYAFNKYELWEWLSKSPETRRHLPETVLARDPAALERLINKYNIVYVKPYRGYRGLGIYRVEKGANGYNVRTRVEDENRKWQFPEWNQFYQFLSQEVDLSKYIAQQSINLLKIDERIMDIRVIAQKGRYGKWEIHGGVSRFGVKESVVSNVSRGGKPMNILNTLLDLAGPGQEMEAYRKWGEIQALALKTCEQVEKAGFHYGNFGIDVALDQNGDLWVIEVNNIYPDHSISIESDNPMLFYSAMGTPLLYAKWLAGFAD